MILDEEVSVPPPTHVPRPPDRRTFLRFTAGAASWFQLAQVPPGMRYADAEAAQGVGRARPRR